MFISPLADRVQRYDIYGECRVNGLKAVYLFSLLCVIYFISNIHSPYFYYFYVAFIAFSAEIIGNTLKNKILFLCLTLLGSAVSIFLFDLLLPYRFFFIMFAFVYSAALYFLVIQTKKSMLPIVALMLGLAAYSLIYKQTNTNLYVAFNHFLQTILALLIMLIGLLLFPKTYYLAIWRRAFLATLTFLEDAATMIEKQEVTVFPACPSMAIMDRYRKMLPTNARFYSVIKITLLTFDLIMYQAYLISFKQRLRIEYVLVFRRYIKRLRIACQKRKPLLITKKERDLLNETHALRILVKIIHSWNYLCGDPLFQKH